MPIKGLTEKRQIPRLGKIRLGIKKVNTKGKEYPAAVDYFVSDDPHFLEFYGDKPRLLHIAFPTDDPEQFASQFYRAYSHSRGLVCKGDGERCRRLVFLDAKGQPEIAPAYGADKRETVWVENLCPGEACPYLQANDCKPLMMLQFLLPDLPGLGIWQLDTSSFHSIRNINSAVDLIQRACNGHIAMMPLDLRVIDLEVSPGGQKTTVHVLQLDIPVKLVALSSALMLPEPDAGAPDPSLDLLYPTPEEVEARETAAREAATKEAAEHGMVIDPATGEYIEAPQDTPDPCASVQGRPRTGCLASQGAQDRSGRCWPKYIAFTKVPKGEDGKPVSRQQLLIWVVDCEKKCEEKALDYPSLADDADDLGIANHWAQLRAILAQAGNGKPAKLL